MRDVGSTTILVVVLVVVLVVDIGYDIGCGFESQHLIEPCGVAWAGDALFALP